MDIVVRGTLGDLEERVYDSWGLNGDSDESGVFSDGESEDDGGASGGAGLFSKRRQDLVRRQVKTWTGQLIDLGGRNNLLYYRDLKQGTLDLGNASERAFADLLANKAVKLSKLFPDPEERATALRRVRAIRNKAKENFEERGLADALSRVRDGDLGEQPEQLGPAGAGAVADGDDHRGRCARRRSSRSL